MGCLVWLYQFLSFLLLFHLYFLATCSSSSTQLCPHDQSIALLQFKNSFSIDSDASLDCEDNGIASYPKTESWREGTDCCSWDGVMCDSLTGHVIGLDLSCSRLNGTIPPNTSLFLLPHLKSLNLASNYFWGSRISPQFGWFANLTHLNLSNSAFFGQVPFEIARLWGLISLDLSSFYGGGLRIETRTLKRIVQNLTEVRELFLNGMNMSSVALDSLMNLSSSLTSLSLRDCQLQSNFPSKISHLSRLILLDVSSYSGELRIKTPTLKKIIQNLTEIRELFLDAIDMSSVALGLLMNLSSSLTSLSLRDCQLQGNFPINFFYRHKLQSLRLNGNYNLSGYFPKSNWTSPLELLDISETLFFGELPDSIGNLKSLKSLSVSGCNFIGSIPSSLKNLGQLTQLDLSYNNFSGALPELIGHLESLKSLSLSKCNFIGSIPSSLKNLGQLTQLDLSNNNFSGGLPESIGYLKSLQYLRFYNCNFIGPIPDVFDNFSELAVLDLRENKFGGQLPSSVFNLSQLEILCLSGNQLVGSIPYQVSRLPNLFFLDLSNNLLTGTIPSWLYTLPSLQSISLFNNKLTGHINESLSSSLKLNLNLREIDLSNNKLDGPLPISIFKLGNLTSLFLSSNNLSGKVELDVFSKLKNLYELDLSYNSRLSLVSTNIHVNYTLPNLRYLFFSSCNIIEFPYFLQASKNLVSLDLSKNIINGQIPKWMWDVGKDSLSYLNLSHNLLAGIEKLPWKSLYSLDLHSNLLQGQLPIPPLTMRFFSISNNSLSGELSSLICNVSSLEILDISHNSLSGIIPPCLGNLSESLSVLDLRKNKFQGTIPAKFSRRCNLNHLNLNGNQLGGLLPRSMVNCRNLEVVDLGSNKINDTFPYWLGNLPKLQVLVLSSNAFHSYVRGSGTHHSFSKLRIFDLSNNDFVGPLPIGYIKRFKAMINVTEGKSAHQYMSRTTASLLSYDFSVSITIKGFEIELVKILTIFTSIDLSKNRFEGEISEDIGELSSLKGLNLSHNNLGGYIPPAIGNLTNLEWLDLSSNKLVGKIPEQLTDLIFLEILNLSHNRLVGSIPQGKQFNTFNNDSYEGNLELCGFPLTKTCSNVVPQQPPQSIFHKEDDSESAYEFGWRVVLMGYGCGMVFGLAMGYLVFRTGKPKWFVTLVEGKQHQKPNRSKRNSRISGGRRN